jgi:hypothetical protein
MQKNFIALNQYHSHLRNLHSDNISTICNPELRIIDAFISIWITTLINIRVL